MRNSNSGFTLIELLVTMGIFAISMSMAVPGMRAILEKSRIQGASEAITAELRFARSEAIKRNTLLSVSFSQDTGSGSASTWCFGLDENPGCDCTLTDVDDADACALPVAGVNMLKTLTSEAYSKITLNQTFTNNITSIEPTRGTVNAGQVILESPDNRQVQIQVTPLGTVQICSNDITGYSAC